MTNRDKTPDQIKELIKRRRFQILVHSYIYFRLFDNIISNDTFDKWAKELIELQKNYPDLSEEVELYEIFKSFTSVGCSSMLPLDDEKLAKKAQMLLDNYNASDTHWINRPFKGEMILWGKRERNTHILFYQL